MSVSTSDGGTGDVVVVAIVPVAIRNGRRGGVTAYSLPCGGCGHMIVVAARTYRDLRADQRMPYCDPCKHPTSVVVTEEHRRYWQDRYTRAEIRFMATCVDSYCERMFGRPLPGATPPVEQRPGLAELALAASASRA